MSRPGLVIELEKSANGVARLTLAGELDIATAHQVHMRLPEATASAECVLVDLSELTFIDSSGIRVLLQLQKIAERGGWRLRLVPGPPHVQQVLRIVGLDARLPFLDGSPPAVSRSAG